MAGLHLNIADILLYFFKVRLEK